MAKKQSKMADMPGQAMVPQEVALADLVFDPKYQMRVDLPSIDEYVSVLEEVAEGVWPFDAPMHIARVKGKLYVVGGFTRGAAAKKAGRESVLAIVQDATEVEAFKLSLVENARHGYRRTNKDKRNAVTKALARWPGYTAPKIAELCAVSAVFVRRVIDDLKEPEGGAVDPQEYEGDPAPQVEALDGPCPVCACVEWVAHDEGYQCAACQHPHGEPAGTDEDEQPPAGRVLKKPAKPAASVQASVVDVHLGQPVATVPPAGYENVSESKGRQAEAAVGRLVRVLDEMGLLAYAEEHIAAIRELIQGAQ